MSVTVRATKEEVSAIMRRVIAGLAGAGDPYGINEGLQLRVGGVLLSKIQQDFVTKSKGGVGEDGISWPDLKPETKAYGRRITRAEYKDALGDVKFYYGKANKSKKSKLLGVRIHERKGRKIMTTANPARPTLTKDSEALWKKTHSQAYGRFMAKFGMDRREANERAARVAWAAVKDAGAKTKLDLFGNRKLDILVDTGLLYRSFASGVEGNINRAEPGAVIVGTNLKDKWYHHRGTSRGLPSRPFWPLDGQLPAAWWEAIQRALLRGVSEAAVMILTRAG